ncbi:MAG: hypothetical protein KDA46_12815 [Parvularculaceae bacterium]|nr:hypothetical protein [Parvularculaceae bacterium]
MSKSFHRAFVALAVLGASATGAATLAYAQAGDPLTNPRGIVANFDTANLGPVLTELGVVWQERSLSNGQRFVAASVGSASFNIIPAACTGANQTNCVGANIVAVYTSDYINPQSVSAFNQALPFVSAGISSDNTTAYVSRYEIADYGIPRGNVASSIINFLVASDMFEKQTTGARTVSAEGYADDLSAAYLNTQSGEAIGVNVAASGDKSLASMHYAEAAATPQLFRVLKESRGVPRNKIQNITE